MGFLKRLHSWFTGNYFARHSNTWTSQKGILQAYGETSKIKMPVNDDGTVDYSLEDLNKMTILCAWCKKPIFIGDPITLYSPRDPAFVIPDHAVVYSTDPLTLVGCVRWDCAETGGDRAGFWQPDSENIGKGCVYRVPSALELLMMKMANGEEEPVVIIGNVHDPNEADELARRALKNQ